MEDKKEAPAADEEKPQVIFLLGGPGSGISVSLSPSFRRKGNRVGYAEEGAGWIPISAGDCLREEKERFGVEWLGNA